MNKNIVIGITIVIVIAGGFLFFNNQKPQSNLVTSLQKQEGAASKGKMIEGFSGTVLAGSLSPYLDFTKADYDKALSSGKIVFLDFYATWCPICRAEAPELKSGFDSLKTAKVIGFRVNYNDSDTDSDEKALATQFGVISQHTKVILKGGKEVLKTNDSWDKNTFASEIGRY